jgi:hypothetical protein
MAAGLCPECGDPPGAHTGWGGVGCSLTDNGVADRIAQHQADLPLYRYEARAGIRPASKKGKVRGVASEVVPGGGIELRYCDHDHAPGVRDCRALTGAQRAEAAQCASGWLASQITGGYLTDLPVHLDTDG